MANESELLEPVETATAPDSEPSLRDTIAEAIDQQPEAQTTEPVVKDKSVIQEPTTKQPLVADPSKPVTTAKAPVVEQLKPPAQWKPAVREKWNALPREVQEEITRREADSMRLIGSVGSKLRFADEVTTHIQPFAERLQQNGVQASDFIGDIFSSVKSLAGGSSQEKAEVVANIVQSYGVDLKTLDAILTRRIQQPPEVAEARRLTARAQSVISRQGQAEQEQVQQQVSSVVTKFVNDPQYEFIDDVRFMMADLVEAGRVNSLAEAYTSAIWANPDTRKILLQREAEARVAAKQKRADHARLAGSSVSGSPRGVGAVVPSTNAATSLRDDVAAAFDAHADS